MPGKSVSPEKITEAVTLRAAGYTATAISVRTGISIRTLSRIFDLHATKKGEVSAEMVEAAKRDLIETITSNDRIKEETARLVSDDLAHASLLRQRMAEATDKLVANDLTEAALLMRAAAAYSTALKNTSELFRHTIRIERVLDAEEIENLPELHVFQISDEDALEMQKAQMRINSIGRVDAGADATEDDGVEASISLA